MSKTQKIIIAVLSVLLCAAVVFTALTFNDGFSLNLKSGKAKTDNGSVDDITRFMYESDMPLLQTENKNVFYSVNTDGTVKYYKYADGTVNEITDGVKSYSVKINCSNQKVPVRLYCLDTGSGLRGYGVFTTEQNSSVKLIPYVFVRMIPCPEAYKSAAGSKYILLTDYDSADIFSSDRTYSDMYTVNPETGKTSIVFSDRDRTVGKNGLYSDGWTVFTDSAVNSSSKNDLLASSRLHDINAETPLWDLMTVENTKATRKNGAVTAADCVSPYIYKSGNDFTCLKKTKNGFDLIKNGNKDSVLKSFTCSISDCVVSDGYVYNKSEGSFTSMADGNTFSAGALTYGGFSSFRVSDDASEALLLFNDTEDILYIYNVSSNTASVVTGEKLVNTVGNLCFVTDSLAMLSSYDSSRMVYYNIFINLGG